MPAMQTLTEQRLSVQIWTSDYVTLPLIIRHHVAAISDVPVGMSMLIEPIDALARQKGRDALFLDFPQEGYEDPSDLLDVDWDSVPIRQQVIAWLSHNQIEWCICGGFADENVMAFGYYGQIYIDVPFDTNNPIYQKLSDYLETREGEMKLPGVKFCYLPFVKAMKNAHHDAPRFWEHWAENF